MRLVAVQADAVKLDPLVMDAHVATLAEFVISDTAKGGGNLL
jgi:hypothetical protein